MSPTPSPRHKAPPPPRRLFALGGASLVTALTMAGALGFGPGAAMGNTPDRNADKQAADSAPASTGDDAGDTSAGEQGDGGDGWLTYDDDTNAGGNEASTDDDPAVPADSGSGKRVVFDMSDQRVWLVGGKERVQRTYLVSGSIHDNLDPGDYQVYSKSLHAVSFDNEETMNYMVRFAQGERAPIGFHDIPAFPDGDLAQTKAELGTPQSAGCIRQWKPDARALWQFTSVGTVVVVTA